MHQKEKELKDAVEEQNEMKSQAINEATQLPNPLLKYFEYAHLPAHLKPVSKAFHDLADKMDRQLTPGREKSAMFRKLLEAKDCAVRAAL